MQKQKAYSDGSRSESQSVLSPWEEPNPLDGTYWVSAFDKREGATLSRVSSKIAGDNDSIANPTSELSSPWALPQPNGGEGVEVMDALDTSGLYNQLMYLQMTALHDGSVKR